MENKYNIQPIEAYVITINGRRHKRTFRDPLAAARLIAWFMIQDKYEKEQGQHIQFIEDITDHAGLECDCTTIDHYGDSVKSPHGDDCPLHDRRTGWFARLRRRLTRRVLADWKIGRDNFHD